MKKGKKKLFGDFFYTVYKNDEERKISYEWQPGEKEEYLKVCELVKEWGGVPLDVPWAKSTNSYKEALINLKSSLTS